MDVLTRYAELDTTKDPMSDDEKAGKGKNNDGSKGQQQNNSRYTSNHGNWGNGGKRKHLEGGSDFVANTNTSFKRQRWNSSGRPFNANEAQNFEEALKGPCPENRTQDKPTNHSWENCYIMQQFRNQAYQSHHGGGGGNPGQPGAGGSRSGFTGASLSGGFHGLGSSGSRYQGSSNHGGGNQHFGQGTDHQGNLSGF